MTLLAAYNFDEASGAVVDVTGNGHGFTPVGNTVRTAGGAGHTDKGLNQTTSSTDAGPGVFGLSANRTMMMWIKSTASVTDGRVFETVASSDTNSIWEFLFRDTAWHLQAWNGATFARATTTRPTDSAWHHLAGTYDGTNLRLYLDATLVATTALASPLRTDGTSVNVFHTCPTTIIDDARFYDVTLTQAQIATDMPTPVAAGGTTPVTATRAATWRAMAQVTSTRAATWDALAVRTSTRAATWDTLVRATGTRATTWRVRAQVAASSRATTWRVAARVTATRGTTWRVRAQVAGSRGTTWRVRVAVSAARATAWNVASSLVAVTATRLATWAVDGRITATRLVVWDTRASAATSRAATWDVLVRATGARATAWRTLAPAATARVTTWAVGGQAYTPASDPTATTRAGNGAAATRLLVATAVTRDLNGAATTREDGT